MGTTLKGFGEREVKYRNAVHDFGKMMVYRQVLIFLLDMNSITY